MSVDLTRNISYTYDVSNVVPSPPLQQCIVEFYRTENHSKRRYGKRDNQYKGTFGFDRFDIKVSPSGMLQTPRNEVEGQEFYYSILGGCIPYDEHYKQGDTKIRKYLCPFISIWPPGIEGNEDSAKSKVRIFVKAKRSINGSKKGKYKIRFESPNPDIITIDGKSSITIEMEINKTIQSFELECKKAFGPEVTTVTNDYFRSAMEINAYLEEEGVLPEDQANVGRLYIIPNRYIFYTELISIIVRLKKKMGTIFDYVNKATSESMLTKIKDLCNNKLPDYLNKNSFNQSLIYFRCQSSNIKTLELNEDEFLKNMKSVLNLTNKEITGNNLSKVGFADEIEALYQSKLLGDTIEKRKIEAKETTQVNEKLKEYISTLKDVFSYDNNNIEMSLNNQVVGKAWMHRDVIMARDAYEKAKSDYENLLKEVDLTIKYSLDKKHKIHLFFFTDIEQEARGINQWVPAFARTYQGVGFIFTACVTDADVLPLIVHEIGHTIALEHTFNGGGSFYYEDPARRDEHSIQKEIDEQQNQLNELQNEDTTIDDNQEYKSICQYINELKSDDFDIENIYDENNNKLDRLTREIQKGIALELSYSVSSIETNQTPSMNIEEETTSTESSATNEAVTNNISIEMNIEYLKNRINILKREKRKAPKAIGLNKITGQSNTLENFMDYKMQNGDFEYKSFKFDQWRRLLVGGVRKYLERKDVK